MAKKGYKMALSEKEKKGVEFGTLHWKKTNTYIRAKEYFKEKCEEYRDAGKILDRMTHFWFDENALCFKMRIVTVETTNSPSMDDIMSGFNNIFSDKKKWFQWFLWE